VIKYKDIQLSDKHATTESKSCKDILAIQKIFMIFVREYVLKDAIIKNITFLYF